MSKPNMKKLYTKIKAGVYKYKIENAIEYDQVVAQIKLNRKNQKKQKKDYFFQKHLLSIPEKLFKNILELLDEKETLLFSKESVMDWFGEQYPEFVVNNK